MDKLSIAIVVESLHTKGGVERRTTELAKGLLSAGHEVHVYANRWDPAVAEGLEYHRIPMLKLGRAIKPLSFAWFAGKTIPKSGYDLVHTQARIYQYDLATLGVGVHRAYLDALGIKARNRFDRAVLRIERAMFDLGAGRRLITNSQKCKGELIDYYRFPEERIHVVHNGVDSDHFRPRPEIREAARGEFDLSPEDVAVLFVGPGFRRKGLDTLIQASKVLPGNVKLLVVGKGKRDDYEDSQRLIWLGQCSSMENCYAAADIFALPTRYDPFANSTMEALSSGVPVVTTTLNGVSEILQDGENGLVIGPNDPDALADRLRELSEKPDLRERIGAAGREAIRPYTWQNATENTMAVYETFLAEKA